MSSCVLCGSVEFYLDSGFYYCSSCQTQKLDFHEAVIEGNEFRTSGIQSINLRRTKKSNNILKSDSKEELTSWEMFNIVLKGLVEQTIAAGAENSLKITVLQLWVSYLSKCQYAFTGSNNRNFDFNFMIRDVELVSGQKFEEFIKNNKQNKLLQVRSKKLQKKNPNKKCSFKIIDQNSSSTRVKRSQIKNIASFVEENKDTAFVESSQLQSQSQTLDNLNNKSVVNDSLIDRFQVNQHSRILSKMYQKFSKNWNDSNKKKLYSKMAKIYSHSPYKLSLSRLMGILHLGMIMTNQEAQVGDMIRWMMEGHILHEDAKCFFNPESIKPTSGILRSRKTNHQSVRRQVRKIADLLQISEIPNPNYLKLTSRYCLELQLPDEFLLIVHKLLISYPPKTNLKIYRSREAVAISYIIIAFKLIFVLDGVTEIEYSKVADTINRKYKCSSKTQRYFSWTKWVEYIECRKRIVSRFHYPSRISLNEDAFCEGVETFSRYWEKRHVFKNNKSRITKVFGNDLKPIIKEMCDPIDIDNIVFPPTLTPMLTYKNELISNHSEKFESSITNILKQSFTSHMLLLPNRFSDLINDVDITLVNHCLRPMKRINKISAEKIPSKFDSIPVEFVVDNDEEIDKCTNNKLSRKRKRSESHDEGDFDVSKIIKCLLKKRLVEVNRNKKERKCIESNENQESTEKRTFYLSDPLTNYWYIHGSFYNTHSPLSVEEFDNACRKVFPSSFLWLFKECIRLIAICPKELYYEVADLETRIK